MGALNVEHLQLVEMRPGYLVYLEGNAKHTMKWVHFDLYTDAIKRAWFGRLTFFWLSAEAW